MIDEIPEPAREHMLHLDCVSFASTPFAGGPPRLGRKIVIVSSAAIHPRGETPLQCGTTEYRRMPVAMRASEIVMSHVPVNAAGAWPEVLAAFLGRGMAHNPAHGTSALGPAFHG